MSKELDYVELCNLTSEEFTLTIKQKIAQQEQIREVMVYNVQVDPDDSTVLVVEFLVGWKGSPSALWTYFFDTETKNYNFSIINKSMVNRFNAFANGNLESLPEIGCFSI